MRNFWALYAVLLLSAALSDGGVVERHQREQTAVFNVDAVEDASQDQIPVAVIEVQEPEIALQSLQVDTAIQTTDNSAAESEQSTIDESELKDVIVSETATYANAAELEKNLGLTEILTDNSKTEAPEIIKADVLREEEKIVSAADKFVTGGPIVLAETVPDISVDQAPLAVAPVQSVVIEQIQQNVPVAASEPEAAVRQATPATPGQSTTPQNFVQFIQASPIGQFFSQLTGGQQQQQQPAGAPAGVASDEPAVTPSVPGFLNPATALTQAQQAVQNAAQTVVNSTSQAFQGLQQFASNIGNQFQNTLSSLSGQNQLSNADSSSSRPPGPIQAIVSNLYSPSTQAPGQQQGPLQGIISFFQGGNRPQTNNNVTPANKPPKNDENNQAAASPLDDKIDGQSEADATNEVRNSEEAGDSFEEPHSGPLIVVNDDPSTITEQISNV